MLHKKDRNKRTEDDEGGDPFKLRILQCLPLLLDNTQQKTLLADKTVSDWGETITASQNS